MNRMNYGAITQPCHVQYWVVALFLSASKNSCTIYVTLHLQSLVSSHICPFYPHISQLF